MNHHAAPPEFGTGLRAKLERVGRARERVPPPPNRDLVALVGEEGAERRLPELGIIAGVPSLPRATGPVAA